MATKTDTRLCLEQTRKSIQLSLNIISHNKQERLSFPLVHQLVSPLQQTRNKSKPKHLYWQKLLYFFKQNHSFFILDDKNNIFYFVGKKNFFIGKPHFFYFPVMILLKYKPIMIFQKKIISDYPLPAWVGKEETQHHSMKALILIFYFLEISLYSQQNIYSIWCMRI